MERTGRPPFRIRRGFSQDAVSLVVGSVLQHSLLLANQIVLGRNLSLREFGELAYFQALLSIYTLFATAGVSAILPGLSRKRAIDGRGPPWALLAWASGTSAFLAALNAILFATGVYGGLRVDLGRLILWISAFIVPVALSSCFQAVFIGFGRARFAVGTSLVMEGLRLAWPGLLLGAGTLSLETVIAGWVALSVGEVLVVGALYLAWSRGFGKTAAEGWTWGRDHWDALSYLAPAAAASLLPRLILFLAGTRHSAEAMAHLGVAMVCMSAFAVVLSPLQTAFLSHIQEADVPGRLSAFLKRGALLVATAGPATAVVAVVAGRFVLVPLFGGSLEGAQALLGILALLFLADAPRVLLDVYFITYLPRSALVGAEAAKAIGILAIFSAWAGAGLEQRLGAVAFLVASFSLGKTGVALAHLRSRSGKAVSI